MRRHAITIVAAALLSSWAVDTSGYHLFQLASGSGFVPVRWQSTGIVFQADTDGPAGSSFQTLAATATSTWNAVVDALDVFGAPTLSAVNFSGANINTAWGNLTGDGAYEFVYDADGTALTALGLDPASINGFGPTRRVLVGSNGVIDDAFFIVTGTRTNFDLQSTLVHELGHILGIAHSSVGMHNSVTAEAALDKIAQASVPTMHPFSLGTGNTARRTLEPDDMAAVRELYPEPGAATRWASIEGEVRRCGPETAVVGVNIRAVNTATPTIQISRFTSYDGNSTGRFVLNYLPAGSYRLVVEPLGANGFTLNRFGNPPATADDDFDFEYLSPSAVELACTEETPEPAADIATVAATAGSTTINHNFRVGAPDLAFVVDDTGSMSEEIAGVRTILSNTITSLQAASTTFPLTAIVTFKDDVTKRIVSNDPTILQTVVNGLGASGGGDCPESSNAALLAAGRMLRRGAVAMLFTDADSRSDGPSESDVTNLFLPKGVRLFTLLSGTCTGSITTTRASGESEEAAPSLQAQHDGPTAPRATPGSATVEEYPLPPTNGFVPAVTTFSNISSATGGFFVAIPGINGGSASEVTRYVNTGTNLAISAVLPAIALVTPTGAPQGTTLDVEFRGSNTNFRAGGSTVSIAGSGVTVNSVTVQSATRLLANLTIDAGATLGFRDAQVVTTLGTGAIETARGLGVMNITAAVVTPTTLSVIPPQGARGTTVDVQISAAAITLTSASTVQFGPGVTVLEQTVTGPTQMRARLQIGGTATIGYRRVSISTPGAGTAVDNSPAGAFQVVAAGPVIPTILSITPSEVRTGETATLTIVGSNTSFQAGVTVLDFGGGITVDTLTVNSLTNLTAVISVAPGATLGFRDVRARTNAEEAIILDGLLVAGTPTTGPLTGVNLTASPGSPQPPGTTIVLSATPQGGTAPISYRFWIQSWTTGVWEIVQDWSTTSTFSWSPTMPGGYNLAVQARSAGGTAVEVQTSIGYEISGEPVGGGPLTGVTLMTSPLSAQPLGTTVLLTAAPQGGTPPILYRFWVKPWTGDWQIVRDWSPLTTYEWTPTSAGGYVIGVEARRSTSEVAEVQTLTNYEIVGPDTEERMLIEGDRTTP